MEMDTDFSGIVKYVRRRLIEAAVIDTGEWQAIRGAPQSLMAEIEDISFSVPINPTRQTWAAETLPNLPWAEDHFEERVGGEPLNPPPSSEWWPFAVRGNEAHKSEEQFSHTYPERLWPKYAGYEDPEFAAAMHENNRGIRFPYGDLGDVVKLLKERPGTRQAYIPIWFPEDITAANLGKRVPCTLGYHLLMRDGKLKIVYYIRSCDFLRHFRDDVYMAGRLCQWVAEQLDATPSRLVMHISSFHVFKSDLPRLQYVADRDG